MIALAASTAADSTSYSQQAKIHEGNLKTWSQIAFRI